MEAGEEMIPFGPFGGSAKLEKESGPVGGKETLFNFPLQETKENWKSDPLGVEGHVVPKLPLEEASEKGSCTHQLVGFV